MDSDTLRLRVKYNSLNVEVILPPTSNLYDLKEALLRRTSVPIVSQRISGFAVDELDDYV
jgi:hypothetical protein